MAGSTTATDTDPTATPPDRVDTSPYGWYVVAGVGVLAVLIVAAAAATSATGIRGGELLGTVAAVAAVLAVAAWAVARTMAESRRETVRQALLAQADATAAAHRGAEAERVRYRELLPLHIAAYRTGAEHHRRRHVGCQIAVGAAAVAASGLVALAGEHAGARVAAVVLTAGTALVVLVDGQLRLAARAATLAETANRLAAELEDYQMRLGQYAGVPDGEALTRLITRCQALQRAHAEHDREVADPTAGGGGAARTARPNGPAARDRRPRAARVSS